MNITSVANKIVKNDYQLVAKIDKHAVADIDIGNYILLKNLSSKIKENVCSYSYVNVGKKSDIYFSKEIISFFNKAGQVIGRVFKDNGKFVRFKAISYPGKNYKITDIYTCKEDMGNKSDLPGREILFNKMQDGSHFYTAIKRVIYSNENGKEIKIFNFSKLYNKAMKSARLKNSYAQMKLAKNSKGYKLFDFHKTDNCDIKRKDKWLILRLLNPQTEEGLEYLAYQLLKNKHLSRLNIKLFPSDAEAYKNSIACFSTTGNIFYHPTLLTYKSSDIVESIAHEAEHAHQCALIGRVGKANSPFERKAQKFFARKPLTIEQSQEAIYYAVARDIYPQIDNRKNLGSDLRYCNNYLEIKATEAGIKAEKEYCKVNYDFIDVLFNSKRK